MSNIAAEAPGRAGRLIGGASGVMFGMLGRLHNAVFSAVQTATENWLLGLFARFTFASVLLFYFWNSAITKVIAADPEQNGQRIATGPLDYLTVESEAYVQILPGVTDFNFIHHVLVYAGTYGEFILPALVVLGLLTRIAALGMIVFIAVQTYVDAYLHGGGEVSPLWSTDFMFDGRMNSPLVDLRLLWLMPLIYLVVRGAGAISLDYLFGLFGRRRIR